MSDKSGGGALGGLIGYDAYGAVASYSTGKVTGVSGTIGGVVGFDCSGCGGGSGGGGRGGYRDTYWDITISALSQGAGNINDDKGLKGLTSHKLRSELPQGFSDKVWTEQGITNRGFPYLINNPPPK